MQPTPGQLGIQLGSYGLIWPGAADCRALDIFTTMARFKWPVPDDAFFRREFADGEAATVEYRIERCKFLWEEFGPPADMLLVGGFPSMFALDELKRSFIYGNFMATVLLA